MSKKTELDALEKCRKNPALFPEKVLGTVKKTDYQQKGFEILLNKKNHRVIIGSSNAMGKTHLLAESILTAYYLWGPGLEIITTAPTWNQVEGVLWTEIRNIYANSKFDLGSVILQTKLFDEQDNQWFVIGFSPKISTSKDLSTFQGFHGPKATIIVFDEGVGVPRQLFESAERMMTGKNCYWWIITNCTDKTSPAAELFSNPSWTSIIWDCFLSDNVKANGIKNIEDLREEVNYIKNLKEDEKLKRFEDYKTPYPSLLTLRWLVEAYMTYGEKSFLFQSLALAKFPETASDTLISFRRVQECMGYFDGDYAKYNGDETYYIGQDVARFGDDSSVKYNFIGNKFLKKKSWAKKDTVHTQGEIKIDLLEYSGASKNVRCGIDTGGVGGGVYDNLFKDEDLKSSFIKLMPVEFGSAAGNDAKYADKITEMWDMAKTDFESIEGFVLEKDQELLNELTSRRYEFITRQGRTLMKIESKDDYKARMGGKSPDSADAFCIYNFLRHNTGAIMPKNYANRKQQTVRDLVKIRSAAKW